MTNSQCIQILQKAREQNDTNTTGYILNCLLQWLATEHPSIAAEVNIAMSYSGWHHTIHQDIRR